ncbi:EAL domain-containing protein [Aliidiomarina celeris]|uniref:EAL domain-containing protein n=1 Tax=Aliidiomarina celeris TaxID=2249428 RepID=UPI000DE9F08A|nr:EAL domain-containing protein [Aliidiomarina celeris]
MSAFKQQLKARIKACLCQFDRMPLGLRVSLAFVLPVIAIVWMSVANILELQQRTQELKLLRAQTRIAVDAGRLIGRLQRERGLSIITVESGLPQYRTQLVIAREETDAMRGELSALLREHKGHSAGEDFLENLGRIKNTLEDLSQFRQRVDTSAVNLEQIYSYYTLPIQRFNNVLGALSSDTYYNSIGRELNAYFILNRFRELLGQERLAIARALVKQELPDRDYEQLVYMAGQQHTLLIGLQSQTGLMRQMNLATEASEFRDRLLNRAQTEALLSTVSSDDWFAWQSTRIDLTIRIERELASMIDNQVASLYGKANNALWRHIIISPLVLLVGLGFALLIFQHVKRSLLVAKTVFEHTHDRITVTDATGTIIDVNAAFKRVTGYDRSESIGQNSRFLQSGRQSKAFYKAMWSKLLQMDRWQGEIWNRRKNGEVYAELTTISAVRDEHGRLQNYISVSSDITERAFEHQRQLEHRAYHDPLTGLPNLMLLRDRLEHAIEVAHRDNDDIIVVSLDIDNFKAINEAHGHTFGDAVIEVLAKRLKATLREGDTLARVSGDEFMFVFEEREGASVANDIFTRIRHQITAPIRVEHKDVEVTTSIGATRYSIDPNDADTLIRHATQALHQAKVSGRDRLVWFDPQQDRSQSALVQLIARLEHAIVERELELYYQPKVNMSTFEVVGVEALLRWRDPERGMVPPGEFLPTIEQHPFSIVVGDWVIEEAIAQAERWQAQGITLPVSVNISAIQLLEPSFIEALEEHLGRHPNFNPAHFEIEVLESAAIGDIHRAAKVLADCRKLGVSVALDDFGTGFAALDYLKRLPAQSLKIDQSFVRDMLTDVSDLTIVKGIIGLAKAFDFNLVAEGVETSEQGKKLVELGCDIGQGYGIARPMPAKDVPQWFQSWRGW